MSMSLNQLINQYINEGWGYHELKKDIRENWVSDCYPDAKRYLKKCRAKGMFKEKN